mmetsp:Transcript_21863/g.60784  ORF Transcript_21863/g.60784 Transcript_21863/m.60784 type:complete len:123 (-) Transcript_21863:77-445(-)
MSSSGSALVALAPRPTMTRICNLSSKSKLITDCLGGQNGKTVGPQYKRARSGEMLWSHSFVALVECCAEMSNEGLARTSIYFHQHCFFRGSNTKAAEARGWCEFLPERNHAFCTLKNSLNRP